MLSLFLPPSLSACFSPIYLLSLSLPLYLSPYFSASLSPSLFLSLSLYFSACLSPFLSLSLPLSLSLSVSLLVSPHLPLSSFSLSLSLFLCLSLPISPLLSFSACFSQRHLPPSPPSLSVCLSLSLCFFILLFLEAISILLSWAYFRPRLYACVW